MKLRHNLIKILFIFLSATHFNIQYIYAAPLTKPIEEHTIGAEQEQLQRDRRVFEERNQRKEQKDVLLQSGNSKDGEDFPKETPAFFIKKITIVNDDLSAFKWLQKEADRYSQRELGQKGLALLSKKLGNLLIDRGYITTKVFIPEQDISTGDLQIQIIRGYIGDIRFEAPVKHADWKSAFPVRPGDLLNLQSGSTL